jgi:hypothetical protein
MDYPGEVKSAEAMGRGNGGAASRLGNDGIFPKSEENKVGSFVELKGFTW